MLYINTFSYVLNLFYRIYNINYLTLYNHNKDNNTTFIIFLFLKNILKILE